MRLLLASIDTPPNQGGVSKVVTALTSTLYDAGHDVTLLGPTGTRLTNGVHPSCRVVVDHDADIGVFHGPVWRQGERTKAIARLRQLQVEHRFDRFVALHPSYYGQIMVKAARLSGIRSSVMFHGFELRSLLMARERLRMLRVKLHGNGPSLLDEYRSIINQADEILTNSHYTASLVRQAGRPNALTVTGCGTWPPVSDLPVSVAKAEGRKLRKSLGFTSSDFVVGTVSRLVEGKKVDRLIEVAALMPELQVLIVGTGELADKLAGLACTLNVHDRVHFAGNISESKKWAHLAAMDAFCLLSQRSPVGEVEGFGIVLLEASAMGIPIIATKSGGMPEVISHGQNGLLVGERTGAKEVARAITCLQENDTFAAGLVKGAQQQLRDKFNWAMITAKLMERWAD